ncbi:hypothetical protein N7468_009735 [Penicillium chermesinum]|uniref:Uncharacterized protein n=1 Tax=Penicillium chermesinum TaxID=63820 RepID=A0A9W9NIB1_9EURO|nr:uncharacterized protein N7468_009735 [Penicillium chermesinum]KAJ5220531.1 hypothetical protein N7468_009735 [Penicillium chermesinum]
MHLLRVLAVMSLGLQVNAASSVNSLPAKSVVEYPLSAAAETHEIIAASEKLLLISQQTDGALVKVALDGKGNPTGSRAWTVTNQWSGLHGLVLHSGSSNSSNSSGATIWATEQFDNTILQIDPNGDDINSPPKIINRFPIPAPAFGPHGILQNKGDLWVACKDSSHVVRITIDNPDEHQIWPVSRRPIFIAVHPTSGDVYSGLDLSSKIWRYQNDGGHGEEMDVPADKGSVPVGLVSGPDGNFWVALLGNSTGGTGTFGRINSNATIDWFTLSSQVGSTAGLIHVAFGPDPSQLWLLGSSTSCASCVNAVFTVKIDDVAGGTASSRIAIQNSIVLPTQYSWTHRIIAHQGTLYVTELKTALLAHISGSRLNWLEHQ